MAERAAARMNSPIAMGSRALGCGLLLACACLVAPTLAQRQAPKNSAPLELQISNQQPFVEEPVLLQLIVHYEKNAAAPDWPSVPGATLTPAAGGAENVQRSFVGAREVQRSAWRAFNAELTPHKAGTLEIPPISVLVDGVVKTTLPARITVRTDDGPALLRAEIVLDAPKIYVGQRVVATLQIWVLPPVIDGRTLDPQLVYNLLDPRHNGFGPFPAATRVHEERPRDSGGAAQRYYVFDSTLEFAAERAGPLTFDDLVVAMRYPRRLRQDIFGQIDVSDARPVRARAAVSAPEVRPLPLEGRPPQFNGAVGRYNFVAWAKPTKVRVGDPIEFTMELSGEGALDSLPAPQLDMQPALQQNFRVPGETLAGKIVQKGKWFTQTIRAKRTDVREIPPVEYAYFDPVDEQYKIARSDTIPLTVTGDDLLAVDVEGLATPSGAPASAPIALDGLRGNETRESVLLQRVAPPSVALIWLGALAPPGLFAAVALGRAAALRSGRDGARRRRSRALASAQERLTAAESLGPGQRTSAIESAVVAYLADRVNQPPARFTGRTVLDFLRERRIDEQMEQRLANLIARCEQAAYAGGADADARITQEARECLRLLEQIRL